ISGGGETQFGYTAYTAGSGYALPGVYAQQAFSNGNLDGSMSAVVESSTTAVASGTIAPTINYTAPTKCGFQLGAVTAWTSNGMGAYDTPTFKLLTNTYLPPGLSPAGSSGDLQDNNGSSGFGAAHINDNGTTLTVTE